jgi:cation:H+ antiporter
MLQADSWNLGTSIAVFVAAALVIALCGVLLTERAEHLARRTGLGEALTGALFLGAITSLAGTITSVSAALDGFPEIAFGNAVGGIAAQTTFIVVADLVYRKGNLEHAAASEANLLQGVLLIALLALPLLGTSWPSLTVYSVDAISFALLGLYLFGVKLMAQSHRLPMWLPRPTEHAEPRKRRTRERAGATSAARLWFEFGALAAVVALAGWLVAQSAIALTRESGLSQTVVGTLFTAVSTSLPELVIALAAVRRGALALAVGNILGGNCFDVLFLVASDVAYRPGSLYHAVSAAQAGWLALGILLTAVLLLGMLRRQPHGPANIGFEGVLVLAFYAIGVAALFAGGT